MFSGSTRRDNTSTRNFQGKLHPMVVAFLVLLRRSGIAMLLCSSSFASTTTSITSVSVYRSSTAASVYICCCCVVAALHLLEYHSNSNSSSKVAINKHSCSQLSRHTCLGSEPAYGDAGSLSKDARSDPDSATPSRLYIVVAAASQQSAQCYRSE